MFAFRIKDSWTYVSFLFFFPLWRSDTHLAVLQTSSAAAYGGDTLPKWDHSEGIDWHTFNKNWLQLCPNWHTTTKLTERTRRASFSSLLSDTFSEVLSGMSACYVWFSLLCAAHLPLWTVTRIAWCVFKPFHLTCWTDCSAIAARAVANKLCITGGRRETRPREMTYGEMDFGSHSMRAGNLLVFLFFYPIRL